MEIPCPESEQQSFASQLTNFAIHVSPLISNKEQMSTQANSESFNQIPKLYSPE